MSKVQRSAQPEMTLPIASAGVPDSFKKAVGVVQVAMGKLGFLHRKIYNVMLANANEGLQTGARKFQIKASIMSEVLDFNSNNIQEIYDQCRDIQQTEVLTIDFDQAKRGRGDKIRSKGGTSLISEFRVFPSSGIIEYGFSEIMAELLGNPDNYIWMTLTQQNRFSSKYELALFENTLRYVGVGSTGFKDVTDWRGLLGANEATYDQFKRLNTMVLKPAIKGVNEKSGIIVEPEFEREKRRISRIKFSVRENPQASLLDFKEHERMREMEIYQNARELGLKEVEIFYWIETKGEEYLREAVSYVQVREKIQNKTAYLVKALRGGFGEKSPQERQRRKTVLGKAEAIRAEREAGERAEREAGKLQAQFNERRREKGRALIATFDAAARTTLREKAREAVPSLGRLRHRLEEVGGDIEKLGDGRTDKLVAGYIATEALKLRGERSDWDIQAYCECEAVPPEVRAHIR